MATSYSSQSSSAPPPKPPARPSSSGGGGGSSMLPVILAAALAGIVAALPALLTGVGLWFLIRGRKQRMLVAVLAAVIGWGVLWLGYKSGFALGQQLVVIVKGLKDAPSTWRQLIPLVAGIWLRTWPAAPTIAMLIESLHPRTFDEQHRTLIAGLNRKEKSYDEAAAKQAKKAPEVIQDLAVLGAVVPEWGDATAFRKGAWAVYPPDLLNRHAIVIGGSGTGKTELIMRLAYLVRKVYGWRVFYLDAKGDHGTAARFVAVMQHAGVENVAMFPAQAYDGWRGSATEIFNRLMAVEEFSEPYYRAITKLMLSLACNVPSGPPRSSDELLERLTLDHLQRVYKGRPEEADVERINEKDARGTYSRYRALFSALGGKLDAGWAYEDVQAGYVLLDGLALKEEARSLGRYLLEDFGQAMVKRLAPGERVLYIVDEFSALSGAAEAEGLFERVRSPHGIGGAGVVITSQSYAGLGDGADRMLQAAATTVVFQCPDPEPLIARAGMHTTYKKNISAEMRTTGLAVRKTTGRVSVREEETLKIHPDQVRRLGVGECYVVPSGFYQKVHVRRVTLTDEQLAAARRITSGASVPPKVVSDRTVQPGGRAVSRPQPAAVRPVIMREVKRPGAATVAPASSATDATVAETGEESTGKIADETQEASVSPRVPAPNKPAPDSPTQRRENRDR